MRRRSRVGSASVNSRGRKATTPYTRRDELRAILETALDAVIVMKSDGVIADWNVRAAGVFGWSRDEAVGRIMADLIIPERYREAQAEIVAHGLRVYSITTQGEAI
jgi:PAS domain S-box-containing protein